VSGKFSKSRRGGWSWYVGDVRSPDPLARMHTMTKRQGKSSTIDVKALLREDEEFLRAALQEVLEAEMTDALGAEKGERTAERQGYRSGYYGRTLISDLLNNRVRSSRLPRPALLLMANLVHGDAGITARLSLGALRPFRFWRATASAGTHELLAVIAAHAAYLRVAVLHFLLLSGELSAGGYPQCGKDSNSDEVFSHRLPPKASEDTGSTAIRRCGRPSERQSSTYHSRSGFGTGEEQPVH
jgi:hypothetical protein